MNGAQSLLAQGMVSNYFEGDVISHMPAAFNLAYWIVRSREEALSRRMTKDDSDAV